MSNKKKEIKNNPFDIKMLLIYLYIFLPLLLFFGLWLKPFYAIVFVCIIVYGIHLSLKSESPLFKFEKDKDYFPKLALVLFIIVLLIITSGVGASIIQYPDHLYRNGIFRILIDHDWPVILNYESSKGLAYYIGIWLPAAFIGKFTSYQVALLSLQIWAILGMIIVYYLICESKKKFKVWYLIAFLLFGGADYLGFSLIGKIFDQVGNRIEWWSISYNYPGILTSIFWVYNQVIYAWIIHLMIQRQNNNKNILFLWCASLLNCTFPAIGMMPFAVYRAIENTDMDSFFIRFKNAFMSCFSYQFIIGLIISIVSGLYLLGNISFLYFLNVPDISNNLLSIDRTLVSNATVISFSAYPWTTKLYSYLWFVLLEFLLWLIAIYKSQSHKSLYWLTTFMLFMCPLIEVGGWIDFCMRASIPALYCLYSTVVDALEDYFEHKNIFLFACLICLFMISAINCKDTLLGVMQPTAEKIWDKAYVQAESFSEEYIFRANNFFSTTNSFFFKYLAKR